MNARQQPPITCPGGFCLVERLPKSFTRQHSDIVLPTDNALVPNLGRIVGLGKQTFISENDRLRMEAALKSIRRRWERSIAPASGAEDLLKNLTLMGKAIEAAWNIWDRRLCHEHLQEGDLVFFDSFMAREFTLGRGRSTLLRVHYKDVLAKLALPEHVGGPEPDVQGVAPPIGATPALD